jgi:hypothetical protein
MMDECLLCLFYLSRRLYPCSAINSDVAARRAWLRAVLATTSFPDSKSRAWFGHVFSTLFLYTK